MKISKFCEKFKTTPTTIRFYIKSGLLIPNKKNTQYDFTKSDMAEMEIICHLKKLCFSLEEIKQYLHIIRLYDIHDEHIRNHLVPLLEMKKESLHQEILNIKKSITTLQVEIDQLRQVKKDVLQTTGIPLDFSPFLACPKCGSLFQLNDLQVRDNRINSGNLSCQCGYLAVIEEGILLAKAESDYYQSSEFHVLHYRESHIDDPDFVFFQYMNDISTESISLIYKSYLWIDSVVLPYSFKNKVIFVPDLASHFLYKNIKKPYFKDAYIIVSGFSKENIMSIKSHIDLIAPEAKIIYIANTIFELPVKKEVIDLWIDAISSYNFSFFHDYPLHDAIETYMKKDAKIAGLTKFYDRKCKSLCNIAKLYPHAMKDQSLLPTFHATLKGLNYHVERDQLIGCTTAPGPYYEYHTPGENHQYYAYYAEKKA